MRTVLLTGHAPEHRYVARRLADDTPGLAAVVVAKPPPLDRRQRLARARRRYGTTGAVARLVTNAALRVSGEAGRRRSEIVDLLGEGPMPEQVPVLAAAGVNSPETRALLTDLRVDVLCVYGTAVVGDDTLARASRIALNLHTGISPRYRGADCAFWPLHNAEPEWLGATVHVCTSELDGGAVYATRRATLSETDGLGGAFARSVLAGADILAAVLKDVEKGAAAPRPQDLTIGREYRAAMRDWRAELRTVRAVRAGLVRDHVRTACSSPGRGDPL